MSVLVPQDHVSGALYEGFAGMGKKSYCSPEVYHGKPLDPFSCDIWSLGIVYYVMLTGRPLYAQVGDAAFRALQKGQFDQLTLHYQAMGCKIPEGPAKNMIRSMLHPNPANRPSAEMLWKTLNIVSAASELSNKQ